LIFAAAVEGDGAIAIDTTAFLKLLTAACVRIAPLTLVTNIRVGAHTQTCPSIAGLTRWAVFIRKTRDGRLASSPLVIAAGTSSKDDS
jgi:hypothetical protein